MPELRLSVCLVSYQAHDYLQSCLHSIVENPPHGSYEITVVDNNSRDGTVSMLKNSYPQVVIIENTENLGFTVPMNTALRRSSGAFLLLLNPDTVIFPDTLNRLLGFLETHPQVGICGPKVLNRDGTMQKPCRRGEPRPWAVFSYFLGLSALFPRSKLFGGYLLNYLDEDQTHPVAGVSGSCMLIRREVIDQIGYLDERFFAYQEDADYCFQARQAGWQVYYVPTAKIVHYGGHGGSQVHPFRSTFEWHRSYWLYYRKNLAQDYFFLLNWLYYAAMGIKLGVNIASNLIRRDKVVGTRKP